MLQCTPQAAEDRVCPTNGGNGHALNSTPVQVEVGMQPLLHRLGSLHCGNGAGRPPGGLLKVGQHLECLQCVATVSNV